MVVARCDNARLAVVAKLSSRDAIQRIAIRNFLAIASYLQ
jgi:hypothetical protein